MRRTSGFHHGRSLRWPGGDWPGDGLLTSDSADALCDLLAAHGVKGPLDELVRSKRSNDAAARRFALYRNLLPQEVINRLANAETNEDAVNAFIEGEPDKAERVKITLRVIGCDHGSWSHLNSLDPLALALLDNRVPSTFLGIAGGTEITATDELIDAGDIIDAVMANKNDTTLVRGGARWFLGENYTLTSPLIRWKSFFNLSLCMV